MLGATRRRTLTDAAAVEGVTLNAFELLLDRGAPVR